MTELEVSSTKNIVSLPPLKKLQYLEKLTRLVLDKIELASNLRFTCEEVVEGTVEVVLPPFPNLQYVMIKNYTGPRLPCWISCLNYLTELYLDVAADVQSLPPLGNLPFLESLSIEGFHVLKFIGRQFLGIDITSIAASAAAPVSSFPKLVNLTLSGLYELNEWEVEEDISVNVMPKLKVLNIHGCPKLGVMPLRILLKASLSLERLFIDKIELPSNLRLTADKGTIRTVFPPFHNLQYLKIKNYMSPIFPGWISCLNYLTELDLHGAEEVQSLPPLGKLPFLEKLSIKGFSALKSIGREFLGIDIEKNVNTSRAAATTFEGIEEDNNQKNIIRVTSFPKLKRLEICYCSELEVWEDIKEEDVDDDAITIMPNLYTLSINNCAKLDVLPHRLLRGAHQVEITGCELASNLRFTGEEIETLLSPFPNLRKVKIWEYMGPRLPSWICCLNYLTELDLYDAAEVQSLPPLGNLPCLQFLSINGFYSLKFIGREFLGVEIEKKVNTSIAAAPAAPISLSSSPKIEQMEEDNNQKNINRTSITSFPKLKRLKILNCSELEVWEDIKAKEDVDDDAITLMPNLDYLHIQYCPKLEVLPHRLLRRASSLRQLDIYRCDIKVRENIVEDAELLSRLKFVKVDSEYLKRSDSVGHYFHS